MVEIGQRISLLGLKIVPYSFSAYFIFRWLVYIWDKRRYSHLVKSIWYLSLGAAYLSDVIGVNIVAMYICFIEAWDLFFQYLEER